jgi:autotransporter-associated beta strand protein
MKLPQKLLLLPALTGFMASGGFLLPASDTYAQSIIIDGNVVSSPLMLTQDLLNFTFISSFGGDTLIQSANPNAANPFALRILNDAFIDGSLLHQLTIAAPIIDATGETITVNDTGEGTLILSGNNSLSSTTFEVKGGTLSFQNSAALSFAKVELKGGTVDFADGFNAGNSRLIRVFSGALNQSQGIATLGLQFTNTNGVTDIYSKTGAGTLILSGNNSTYSGRVFVQEGTLGAANNNSFGTGQVILHNGGLLLAYGVSIANAIQSNVVSSSIDVETGDTATLTGVISGNSGLTKIGEGMLTLSGNNTYTGATTVSEGTLAVSGSNQSTLYQVDSGATLQGLAGVNILDTAALSVSGTYDVDASDTIGSVTGSGSIDIANGQTLTTGAANTDTTFSGVVSGDGALTKTGTGTLTLSGNNTYTGGTTVSTGTLVLGHSNGAGTGTITTTGSVIDYADGVEVSNAINVNSNSTQLQVNTGSATQSGVISETSGPRPLEKIGTGTLTLSGNNTYTGGTNVNGGTLAVTSTLGGEIDVNSGGTLDVTGTLTGLTNVNSGGILDVTGTVTGLSSINSGGTLKGTGALADVNILNGGTFAPGASIGTINTGNLTLNSGSTLEIEVDENGNSDIVNVTGTVSLGGSTLDINSAAGAYTNTPKLKLLI